MEGRAYYEAQEEADEPDYELRIAKIGQLEHYLVDPSLVGGKPGSPWSSTRATPPGRPKACVSPEYSISGVPCSASAWRTASTCSGCGWSSTAVCPRVNCLGLSSSSLIACPAAAWPVRRSITSSLPPTL